MDYVLRAKDPNGEFVRAQWRTPHLPRIGEHVMLPEDLSGEEWQEMTVTDIFHWPGELEVWLGGSEGWPYGSVVELFTNAGQFTPVALGTTT